MFLRKLFESDYDKAQASYKMGLQYELGKGKPEDQKKAINCYEKAANLGLDVAQYRLGIYYAQGKSEKLDMVKAVYYLQLAAKQKLSAAQFQLGLWYLKGQGVTKDEKKAVMLLQLSAKQNFPQAQYRLGDLYLNGRIIQKNEDEGIRLLKLSAVQNCTSAQNHLGYLYKEGHIVKQDFDTAKKYYQLAIDNGCKESLYQLAFMYETGNGVVKDVAEAAKLYHLAAKQNFAFAQYKLAFMYISGSGVDKNEQKAIELFQSAADGGMKEAFFKLAYFYRKGDYVTRDIKLAKKLFKQAADQGLMEAQYELALMYENIHKEEKAFSYLELAANQGYPEAQQNLSLRYLTGRGVAVDLKKSEYYLSQATKVQESKYEFLPPSLQIKIYKKTSKEIATRGFYELIISDNVSVLKSYIPTNPPIARDQRGPTCGLKALEISLNWGYPDQKNLPARKHIFKPTRIEKEKDQKEDQKPKSLREIAKKYGSVLGEMFDIYPVEKTAKEAGNYTSSVIHEKKDTYIKKLVEVIGKNNSIILPVDIGKDNFPAEKQGQETHYALAWGYIYMDDQYYFIVTHRGRHYLWSAQDLLASHEQMPHKNPFYGKFYKNKETNRYEALKDIVPEPSSIRVLPESTLENFKFCGLAVHSQEQNLFTISDFNADSRMIIEAIQKKDVVKLKLFAENNPSLFSKNQAIYLDLAKKINDASLEKIVSSAFFKKETTEKDSSESLLRTTVTSLK